MPASIKIIIEADAEKAQQAIEIVSQALSKLGYSQDIISQALEQGVAAGDEFGSILSTIGVATEDANSALEQAATQLGLVAEAEEKAAASGEKWYSGLLKLRGGWLNLVSALVTGHYAITLLHGVVTQFTDAIREAAEKSEVVKRQIDATTQYWNTFKTAVAVSVVELLRVGQVMELVIEGMDRYGFIMEAVGRVIAESGLPVIRELGVVITNLGEAFQGTGEAAEEAAEKTDLLVREYEKLLAQDAAAKFEDQRQAIYEASESAGEYTLRLMGLLATQGRLIEVMKELGPVAFIQAAGLDFAARAADKLSAAYDRMMGRMKAATSAQDEFLEKLFAMGQASERVGHQLSQAFENFSFRSQQAMESFAFNYEQTVEASQMRVWSMTERFHIQMWAAGARFAATAEAAAARHALTMEGINQDHLDRLSDMEWAHERNKLRMLQRAPWWLQRELQDYQREKARLEEAGDTEGLQQLKQSLRDRLAAIDPVFAEQLDMLEEEFEHERGVEDREWGQRLSRTERAFAIQRAYAERSFAISQAQAQAQFAIQRAMEEFQAQQRLDRLEFQEQQRRAALTHSYQQQVGDLEFGLGQQKQSLVHWAERDWLPTWRKKIGRGAGKELRKGLEESLPQGDTWMRVRYRVFPSGTIPPL